MQARAVHPGVWRSPSDFSAGERQRRVGCARRGEVVRLQDCATKWQGESVLHCGLDALMTKKHVGTLIGPEGERVGQYIDWGDHHNEIQRLELEREAFERALLKVRVALGLHRDSNDDL